MFVSWLFFFFIPLWQIFSYYYHGEFETIFFQRVFGQNAEANHLATGGGDDTQR